MRPTTNRIRFVDLEERSLGEILKLQEPLLVDVSVAQGQLTYVEDYVRDPKWKNAVCRSVVIEEHYVDRDYMEDHSVFYSRNLVQYQNSCRRVHFFSLDVKQLKTALRDLRAYKDPSQFQSRCATFSESNYLGFSVIKPLPGCPVGRTVLRCLPDDSPKRIRRLKGTCVYKAHLLGVPLTIRGLAFQQQDLGVSACATTALWSALQRAREQEEAGAATPAQITMRATQYSLVGRAMPSEGLTLEQMCHAVRSLGYAPHLIRAENFEVARGLLHSAITSGISPVLAMQSLENKSDYHAVAVAGAKLIREHVPVLIDDLIDDRSGDIAAVYIHDDRYGPYLRADIERHTRGLSIRIPLRKDKREEKWLITHVLIPMHVKVRLSFGELRETALLLVREIHVCRDLLRAKLAITSWDCWIQRSHNYLEELITGPDRVSGQLAEKLARRMVLPRYVGVVRVEAADLDPTDFLLDTTSTRRNLHLLGVVQRASTHPETGLIVNFFKQNYELPSFIA